MTAIAEFLAEYAARQCGDVSPFNRQHRCTLLVGHPGHPAESAHTDGIAAWPQRRLPEPKEWLLCRVAS